MRKFFWFVCLVTICSCTSNGGDEINVGVQESEACLKIKAAVEEARQTYINSPQSGTEANCKLYVNALKDQIIVCGDPDGEIQKIIDSLKDCTDNI